LNYHLQITFYIVIELQITSNGIYNVIELLVVQLLCSTEKDNRSLLHVTSAHDCRSEQTEQAAHKFFLCGVLAST